MIFDAKPSDIDVTDNGMVVVSGLPVFRANGGCFEFLDLDKRRCKARGGRVVRVRIEHLVMAMKAKKE